MPEGCEDPFRGSLVCCIRSSRHSKLTLTRDTVSSLGLIKKDVHITASATVTIACHFRHALALDERRVKFMPEYFAEVNAHHSTIQTQRSNVSDVKEVWFAGGHSDVYVICRSTQRAKLTQPRV